MTLASLGNKLNKVQSSEWMYNESHDHSRKCYSYYEFNINQIKKMLSDVCETQIKHGEFHSRHHNKK